MRHGVFFTSKNYLIKGGIIMKPKQKRLYVKRQKALAETVTTMVVKKEVAAEEKPVAKKQKSMWSRKKKD
jgi:hypothetical protein